MAELVEVTLQIRDSAREPTPAALLLEPIPMGRRAGRAAVRLVALWCLAVGSALIPLLHFVLVPGFFVAGPVFAWLAFRATVVVRSAEVPCPKCAQVTPIEPGTTGWPLSLWCAACGTTFFARAKG